MTCGFKHIKVARILSFYKEHSRLDLAVLGCSAEPVVIGIYLNKFFLACAILKFVLFISDNTLSLNYYSLVSYKACLWF